MGFAVSYRFWKVVFLFLLQSMNFLIFFLISFSSVLFRLHVFEYFLGFLPLLRSTFILLWSDMINSIISVFLNLLRLVLCPTIWSTLENVSWAAEKNVYYLIIGWNSL
jgi:hypothetical protein